MGKVIRVENGCEECPYVNDDLEYYHFCKKLGEKHEILWNDRFLDDCPLEDANT